MQVEPGAGAESEPPSPVLSPQPQPAVKASGGQSFQPEDSPLTAKLAGSLKGRGRGRGRGRGGTVTQQPASSSSGRLERGRERESSMPQLVRGADRKSAFPQLSTSVDSDGSTAAAAAAAAAGAGSAADSPLTAKLAGGLRKRQQVRVQTVLSSATCHAHSAGMPSED